MAGDLILERAEQFLPKAAGTLQPFLDFKPLSKRVACFPNGYFCAFPFPIEKPQH